MDIRLNKFISDSGYCSRREADRFIEGGKVTLNKRVATLGDRVTSPSDIVKVNGNLIECDTCDHVYIALNKPVGVTSTTDPTDKTNVVDFINYPTRIFHIGRLDKDSEGLLLLTNNGDIVNKILRAGNNHEKEYEVWVDKPLDEKFAQRMSSGIKILGTVTKPCKVEVEGVKRFRITLTQGLNRQIRRMCESLGYTVERLKRVRIMNIKLAPLAVGQWRELEEREMAKLLSSLDSSDGEEGASKGAGAPKRNLKQLSSKQSAPKQSSSKPTSNTHTSQKQSAQSSHNKSRRGGATSQNFNQRKESNGARSTRSNSPSPHTKRKR